MCHVPAPRTLAVEDGRVLDASTASANAVRCRPRSHGVRPQGLGAFRRSILAPAKHVQQHDADNDQHNTDDSCTVQLFAPYDHADHRNNGCPQS